jgi:hypothetical protein
MLILFFTLAVHECGSCLKIIRAVNCLKTNMQGIKEHWNTVKLYCTLSCILDFKILICFHLLFVFVIPVYTFMNFIFDINQGTNTCSCDRNSININQRSVTETFTICNKWRPWWCIRQSFPTYRYSNIWIYYVSPSNEGRHCFSLIFSFASSQRSLSGP